MNSGRTNGHPSDVDVVAILDAGAQYGKLIDRCIRQHSIKTEFVDLTTPVAELRRKRYKALVISGGPGSLTEKASIRCDPQLLSIGIPILGICYGMQLIVELCGYQIQRMKGKNDGRFKVSFDSESRLFENVRQGSEVLLTHGDAWVCGESGAAMPGFQLKRTAFIEGNRDIAIAAEIADIDVYGVQFHPEAQLTDQGKVIFHNFLINIVRCRPNYTLDSRMNSCLERIRLTVKPGSRAVVLVSGGIDSAVCACLLVKILGPENVYCVHINNGFSRKYECDLVVKRMPEIVYGQSLCCDTNFVYLDEEKAFFGAYDVEAGETLSDCMDPEVKRRIIGDTFISLTENVLEGIRGQNGGVDCLLVQGTLRPDLIESASKLASGSACCIKTHHNDSPLVREMRARGLILEPLLDFHKDEVRRIGRSLGLPAWIVDRHPFPGPGLAIRILCADNGNSEDPDYLEALSQISYLLVATTNAEEAVADPLIGQLRRVQDQYGLKMTILPVLSVGVSGDSRTYKYPIAVFCPAANPASAQFWQTIASLVQPLLKTISHVNRVVYSFRDYSLCLQRNFCRLDKPTVTILQDCDHLINAALGDCLQRVSQMPIILLPLGTLCPQTLSLVLRPVRTEDFMTASVPLPVIDIDWEKLFITVSECLHEHEDFVCNCYYDMTTKPPGTTEWE